jgi:2',3'-cyclic-nucleotide 2'-phosphodiesterase (5'-nucleotidase family)
MKHVTILQINDLHGYIEPHPELVRGGDGDVFQTLGGLARIATAVEQVRAETDGATLLLDNGDTFHGTYVAVQSKGEALIPLMNALAPDAMTVHWEFAYGPAQVERLAGQLTYPILAINCYRNRGGLFFQPYRMVEKGGLRIAVIGIACNIIDKTMPPAFSEGLHFILGREELPSWITYVRKHEAAELVVVLSHLGFPQDVKLASEVDGIDVLVSGHTHNRMESPVLQNGAIIFQSGCHGSFLGRLDLDIEDGIITAHHHRLIAIDERFAPNQSVQQQVDAAMAPHRAMLSQVVGHTEHALSRYQSLHCSMDDLLLGAIASAAGTDIAFSNGWRYGAPVPPGPITLNDLWNIIPTNPPVETVELTGNEIRAMLEENLERTFSANAYEQMGGYVKRCRGLKLYAKIENPHGSRVDRLFVLGSSVEPERIYKVAFVTSQGVPPQIGSNRQQLDIHAIDALQLFLQRASTGTCDDCSVIAV